jgi:uncharacterized C2H2 Zn-finger protein
VSEFPKCPKCKKEISFLKNCTSDITEEYKFSVSGKGFPEYEFIDSVRDGRDEFKCPECGATLFDNEDEAIRFLQKKMGLKSGKST